MTLRYICIHTVTNSSGLVSICFIYILW